MVQYLSAHRGMRKSIHIWRRWGTTSNDNLTLFFEGCIQYQRCHLDTDCIFLLCFCLPGYLQISTDEKSLTTWTLQRSLPNLFSVFGRSGLWFTIQCYHALNFQFVVCLPRVENIYLIFSVSITYFMVGFSPYVESFFSIYLNFLLVSLCASGFGYAISAIAPSPQWASSITPPLITPLFIFCGVIV